MLRNHIRSNLVGYLALFLSLGLGTAWAAGPLREGSPAGGDLTGTYPNPSIAQNAVEGQEVRDGSLTATDIDGASLAGFLPSERHSALGFPTTIDTEWPQKTTVQSLTVGKGSFLLVASGQAFLSDQVEDLLVHTATVECEIGNAEGSVTGPRWTLQTPGGSNRGGAVAVSEYRVPFTFVETATSADPQTYLLRCWSFDTEAVVRISLPRLRAIELASSEVGP